MITANSGHLRKPVLSIIMFVCLTSTVFSEEADVRTPELAERVTVRLNYLTHTYEGRIDIDARYMSKSEEKGSKEPVDLKGVFAEAPVWVPIKRVSVDSELAAQLMQANLKAKWCDPWDQHSSEVRSGLYSPEVTLMVPNPEAPNLYACYQFHEKDGIVVRWFVRDCGGGLKQVILSSKHWVGRMPELVKQVMSRYKKR